MTERQDRWSGIRGIWQIIDRLRGEGGCPWDRKQTPQSVQTYLVEEAHEAAAAVRQGAVREAGEELGDLLFMVLFLIHLYEERGDFTLEQVSEWITTKMIRRHPHVFGEITVETAQQVRDNWEKIKAEEQAVSGKEAGEVPASLPALMRAYRLFSRHAKEDASRWEDRKACALRFRQHANRLPTAPGGDPAADRELFAELLAELTNLARLSGLRAEDCLQDWLSRTFANPGPLAGAPLQKSDP